MIELKLNQMLHAHLNLTMRQKLIKTLLPLVVCRFELNTQDLDEFISQKEFILNKYEFVQALDETSRFLKEIVNCEDNFGQRPLHLAVEQNYLDLVNLFFKYGALPMLYASNHALPIHIAAKTGSVEMFALLEHHDSISFKSDGKMENLFHIAAFNNSVDFLRVACDYFKRRFEQLKHFKDFQFALDAVNSHYLTPLFLAASKSNTECVKVFIEINPSSQFYVDDYNRNIFHICCMFNSYNTFKFLVDYIESKLVEAEGNGELDDLQDKLLHYQEAYKLSSSNPSLLDNYMSKTLKNHPLVGKINIFVRFSTI